MSEFDWSQDIKADHRYGAGISGEEFYQALIERMQREGWIKREHELKDEGFYITGEALDKYTKDDPAIAQAYAMNNPHAETCASRRGQNLCTCQRYL